jgi:hypothetical protein
MFGQRYRAAKERAMKVPTVLIALAVLVIAVPSVSVAVIARPYVGLPSHRVCSAKDVAAVRQVQGRYGLQRAYVTRLIRADFPQEDAEQTLKRHVKNAVRQIVLTHVRSDAYLAASFCERTTAYYGPTDELVSIPLIAGALAPVDNTDGRYLLAVCASLESVNLQRSPEEVRARCARHTAIWDKRRIARLTAR